MGAVERLNGPRAHQRSAGLDGFYGSSYGTTYPRLRSEGTENQKAYVMKHHSPGENDDFWLSSKFWRNENSSNIGSSTIVRMGGFALSISSGRR